MEDTVGEIAVVGRSVADTAEGTALGIAAKEAVAAEVPGCSGAAHTKIAPRHREDTDQDRNLRQRRV
jgi:hypothetical protein